MRGAMRWVLWFQRPQFMYAPNDKVRTGAFDWPSHWRRALFLSTLASVHDILCWTVSVRARFPNTLANSASSNEQSRLFSNWRISSFGGEERRRGKGREEGGERRKGGAAQGVQGRRKPQNRPDRWPQVGTKSNVVPNESKQADRDRTKQARTNITFATSLTV